jgi:hypothetical protein
MFIVKNRVYLLFIIILLCSGKNHSQVLYDSIVYDDKSDYSFLDGIIYTKPHLKYYFNNYTSDISQASQEEAIREAFSYWCSNVVFTFTQTYSSSEADITIYFQNYDGVNGVLAYMPSCCNNTLVFDEAETWTVDTRNSGSQPIDIKSVAAHEIGHLFGIGHSSVSGALMYPFYNGSHRYLASDDINGIRAKYNATVTSLGVVLLNTTLSGLQRVKTTSEIVMGTSLYPYVLTSTGNLALNAPVIIFGDGFSAETGSNLWTLTELDCSLETDSYFANFPNDGHLNGEEHLEDIEKEIGSNLGKFNINVPLEFSLSQNYPNPFNPTTLVQYSLKENVNVKITVYDILGRIVKTLVNEYQDAGYRSVMWDGTNSGGSQVSTGLYIYKIEAGSFIESKKMLLVK